MILSKLSTLPTPFQNRYEWAAYLEFISAYFQNRDIYNPLVLEIGVYKNIQRYHYKTFLNATHIGIDINPEHNPTIAGDSNNPNTLEELRVLLDGRKPHLLFIDGDHSYPAVKRDYELYSPLVSHIVALHDIHYAGTDGSVSRLWADIKSAGLPWIEFGANAGTPITPHPNMGIGLIIKG